jgi:hypothetical protein
MAKRLLEHNTKHKTQNTKHKNTQQPTWAATDTPPSGYAIYCHGNIRYGLKSRHIGSMWVC